MSTANNIVAPRGFFAKKRNPNEWRKEPLNCRALCEHAEPHGRGERQSGQTQLHCLGVEVPGVVDQLECCVEEANLEVGHWDHVRFTNETPCTRR
eukprot:3623349-Prorocentrum_lima.AAC.1